MKRNTIVLLIVGILTVCSIANAMVAFDLYTFLTYGNYARRPSWEAGTYLGMPYANTPCGLSSRIFIKSTATPTWELWNPTTEELNATDYVAYTPE